MTREQFLVLANMLLLTSNLLLWGYIIGLHRRVAYLEKWRQSKRKRIKSKRM